jgi:coenzyme F420H2 oxidase
MKADAIKITDNVYWVGVLDWDIRDYHGYTLNGTTYNAYIVFGDKVALIDNTYPGTSAQMWGRIRDAFEKEEREFKLDIIIQNHVEKDHSGALVEICKKFPDVPVYCTSAAVKGLKMHYPSLEGVDFRIVKTGETLDLGGKQLVFLEAQMLHWPDSMFTLLLEDGILFSNDAFGQHLCLKDRYDSDIPENVLMDAAAKFYANLLTPLSGLVLNKFKQVTSLELLDKITMIAPSHGMIWTDPMKIIDAYSGWATGKCDDKVTIVYDTMHGSTQLMAQALAEGIMSQDVDVKMHFLHSDERSNIVTDILDSKAILLGVPTMFNQIYPSIGDLIFYLRGLKFDKTGIKRKAVTFGSMGWSGEGPKILAEELEKCGFEVEDQIKVNYVPSEEELEKCYEIGSKLALELLDL